MRSIRRWLLSGLGLVVLAGMLVAGNTLRSYAGLFTDVRTPAQLSTLLSPGYDPRVPDGQGPFPTALLFLGCDGPHDNLDRLARDRMPPDGLP